MYQGQESGAPRLEDHFIYRSEWGTGRQLTLLLSTGFDSNSQNLTSLSALPLTSACPSARTWMDHTVDVWAFTVSTRFEEATSYMRISPDFVPTAIYEHQLTICSSLQPS